MDPGFRTPLIDTFRRTDTAREVRLLAAQGALGATAHEQLALLMLVAEDGDAEIASTAQATLQGIPQAPLRAFLSRPDVPPEMLSFFAGRGVAPAAGAAAAGPEPLLAIDDDDEGDPDGAVGQADDEGDEQSPGPAGDAAAPKILAGLPIKKKIKLASKGTREQRAQLIRDPNKLVAAAVLSSPKLTDAEVESFAKMANVSEEVLRVIGMNRTWLKNYGVLLGLVKNPKTPPAISMQLLPRVNERDLKMLTVDRNVPEALRLAARKFVVKGLK
jgi:hypothetical protein